MNQIQLLELAKTDDELDFQTMITLKRLRELYPHMDDRSVKADYISCRCPTWLRDDFEYVSKSIEGEHPAVVLRRLVRNYIKEKVTTPSI